VTDVLERWTCRLCGGTDAHKPECKYYGTCEWCGVAADDALVHGHHPDCPQFVRERVPVEPVPNEDRPTRKRHEYVTVVLGPDGVAAETHTTAIEVEYGPRRVRLHVGGSIRSLPPLTPLVDGLLHLPGESALFSPPKRGKTFVALDLALSVGSGEDFMGRAVKPCQVLYVAAEGVGGLGARVEAWCDTHTGADISRVAFLTEPVNLIDEGDVEAFAHAAADRELVVIDTLARCSVGADENSARDMGRVVTALDRIRDVTGHVCVVHHAGKDTSKGLRGSSALLGAVDTVIELSGDTHALRLAVTDQKDAEPPPPWYCRLTPVGASAVVEMLADVDVISAAQRKVLDALEALAPEDRTSTKWAEMSESGGVTRPTFYRAKQALLERRIVGGGGGRGELYHPIEEVPDE
jgi:hypothetical protein